MESRDIKVRSSEFGVRSINAKLYKIKAKYELFSPHSAFRNPQSGMTLIEVIVVMIIIGILAATLIPRIDFGATSSTASVAGAAYMIASDIRYAQEWAMANGVSKEIDFTSTSYSFNPSSPLDTTAKLFSGVTIDTSNTSAFKFNSLGEPITGGGLFVRVSGGGVTRTITVTQYTGKVSIS